MQHIKIILSLLLVEFANAIIHVDDNTLKVVNKISFVAKSNLEATLTIFCKWFYENHKVLSPGKYY